MCSMVVKGILSQNFGVPNSKADVDRHAIAEVLQIVGTIVQIQNGPPLNLKRYPLQTVSEHPAPLVINAKN